MTSPTNGLENINIDLDSVSKALGISLDIYSFLVNNLGDIAIIKDKKVIKELRTTPSRALLVKDTLERDSKRMVKEAILRAKEKYLDLLETLGFLKNVELNYKELVEERDGQKIFYIYGELKFIPDPRLLAVLNQMKLGLVNDEDGKKAIIFKIPYKTEMNDKASTTVYIVNIDTLENISKILKVSL